MRGGAAASLRVRFPQRAGAGGVLAGPTVPVARPRPVHAGRRDMAEAAPVPVTDFDAAQRLRIYATYASLAVAAVLIAAKLVVWISTGSVALLSRLVDSFVDAAGSLINFFAARQA